MPTKIPYANKYTFERFGVEAVDGCHLSWGLLRVVFPCFKMGTFSILKVTNQQGRSIPHHTIGGTTTLCLHWCDSLSYAEYLIHGTWSAGREGIAYAGTSHSSNGKAIKQCAIYRFFNRMIWDQNRLYRPWLIALPHLLVRVINEWFLTTVVPSNNYHWPNYN